VATVSAQMPRFCSFWEQRQQVGSDPQKGWKRGSSASFTAREGHSRPVKPMARVRAEPSKNRALDLSLAAARPASRPWKGGSAARYFSRPEMHELRTIVKERTSCEISGFCRFSCPETAHPDFSKPESSLRSATSAHRCESGQKRSKVPQNCSFHPIVATARLVKNRRECANRCWPPAASICRRIETLVRCRA